MFKVLLAAHLFIGGQLVEPSIAQGVPEVEFASKAECEAKVETDEEFKQIVTDMFRKFLAGKVMPGIPIAIVSRCMPAADADAAVPEPPPPGQSI